PTGGCPAMAARDRGHGWDLWPRCAPLLVGLKLQPELFVEDLKVAVPTAHDRLWHDHLHFLRHDADIDLVAAFVAEAIEPKAVVESAEQGNVMLKRNIGPPATADSSSATHAGRRATDARCSPATTRGHSGWSSATADALPATIGLSVSLGA